MNHNKKAEKLNYTCITVFSYVKLRLNWILHLMTWTKFYAYSNYIGCCRDVKIFSKEACNAGIPTKFLVQHSIAHVFAVCAINLKNLTLSLQGH